MKKNLNELGENALNYLSATLFHPSKSIYAYGKVSEKTHQIYQSKREYWCPCENWLQAGLIISQEKICLAIDSDDGGQEWQARPAWYGVTRFGPTPLIAVVRCYIASKLGDVIDIPEEYLDDY